MKWLYDVIRLKYDAFVDTQTPLEKTNYVTSLTIRSSQGH